MLSSKNLAWLALFFATPLLGGCPGGVGQIPPGTHVLNQTPIIPTTNLKVGHLYFEGTGQRPAFQLADGTVYSEICYNDFMQTNALKNIRQYIAVSDTPYYSESTTTIGDTFSANVTGIKFNIFSAGAKANFNPSDKLKVIDARAVTLSLAGIEIVRKSIGAACRNELANKKVILIADATRADSAVITSTRSFGAGGSVNVGGTVGGSGTSVTATGPGGGGDFSRNNTVETTYKLVYVYLGNGNSFSP